MFTYHVLLYAYNISYRTGSNTMAVMLVFQYYNYGSGYSRNACHISYETGSNTMVPMHLAMKLVFQYCTRTFYMYIHSCMI